MKMTMGTPKSGYCRRTLAAQAMRAAITVRAEAELDQHSPICIYGLCETLGVRVRLNNINMEGMYQRGRPPRIHLSARRPLPRRVYNCAHELGHHIFGHGSSIDELREEAKVDPWEDPKEFLADVFAGFTLMPIMGLRRAFAARGWTPETATAIQLFTIACDFGVGYRTLLTHLSVGVNMVSRGRAATLKRISPRTLRADILGSPTPEPLIITDRNSVRPTLDTEVNMLVLVPAGTETSGATLSPEGDLATGRLFRTVRPGIAQVKSHGGDWSAFIRVAPQAYVGLAQYRHLEDDPDE